MIKGEKTMMRKACAIILIAIFACGMGLSSNAPCFAYEAIELKVDKSESTSCRKNNPKCPPFVIYYNDKQRKSLTLEIKDGLVVDWKGNEFDTTGADVSNYIENGELASAAIFVMDMKGNIYASKAHKTYLFQHSTILAGSDVAAAGEMIVEDGIIKKVNPCSGHYKPKALTSASQLLISLHNQKYKGLGKITFYTNVICNNEGVFNKAKLKDKINTLIGLIKIQDDYKKNNELILDVSKILEKLKN